MKKIFHSKISSKWYSRNPLDKVEAVTEHVSCANPDCSHSYRPLDGIVSSISIRCPKCETYLYFKEEYVYGMAQWQELAPVMTKNEIFVCKACFHQATTAYATFRQNIGLLLVRLSSETDNAFCKGCMRRVFIKNTLVTATV